MTLSNPRPLVLVFSGLATALLGGCAAVQQAVQGPAAEESAAVRLQVEAPAPLKALLQRHLDLARLPRLAAAAGTEVTAGEIERLVQATPDQARELLATEGYFDPDVSAERLPGEPATVRIVVAPNAQTRVRRVDVDATGEVALAPPRGDPQADAVRRAFVDGWPLTAGMPFRDEAWSTAKRNSVGGLRAQGYLSAQWQETRARVDAEAAAADLTLRADSGPLYRIGPLQIEGLRFHDAQTVRNLAALPPDAPATEGRLLDFQERLQKSGLFERATVQVDPEAADPKAAPLQVRLAEAKLQEATVGLGFKTDEGVYGSLKHEHRRVFGWAATARNRFELSQTRQAWDGEIATHPLPGLWRNLVGGALERLVSDEDIVTSARVRLGRAQTTKNIDRLYFVQAERSLRETDTVRETSDALSAHFHGLWRHLDDNLLPTRGRALAGQVGGGFARSNVGDSGPFARLYASARGFWPVGGWYLQGRVEAGQIVAADGIVVPESMRFRTGGDNSVRGYAYRSLTPVRNGAETSGRVLFTTSVEAARPILARLPLLWGAVFIDAGRAADRWRDLKPAIGVGAGLRYRSPVGSLSIDLAYGEEVRQFRLHVSVGTSF